MTKAGGKTTTLLYLSSLGCVVLAASEYCVATSRYSGVVLGLTNLVSYSCMTSLEIRAESLLCWEKHLTRYDSCTDVKKARAIAVATVVLGLGSDDCVGRNIQ